MTAQTNRERQEALRARRTMLGMTEVRGIYLPPDLHAALKAAAQKLLKKSLRPPARQNAGVMPEKAPFALCNQCGKELAELEREHFGDIDKGTGIYSRRFPEPPQGGLLESVMQANFKLAGAIDMIRETLDGGAVDDLRHIINAALEEHHATFGPPGEVGPNVTRQ